MQTSDLFAFHRDWSPSGDKLDWFQVTHVPSGYALLGFGQLVTKQALARYLAEELEDDRELWFGVGADALAAMADKAMRQRLIDSLAAARRRAFERYGAEQEVKRRQKLEKEAA